MLNNWPVTPLSQQDIPQAAALSRSFFWPHRLEDWALMLDIGTGWKIAQGDDLLSTLLCWHHGPDHATLGMIMTRSDMQRRGIGKRLMDHAIADLSGRQISLNATPDGLRLYEQSGFRITGEITQSQGQSAGAPDLAIKVIETASLDAICLLDRNQVGFDRQRLLTALMAVSDIVLVPDQGYAMCRPFGHGRVIGPVIARDKDVAKSLIAHFLQRYKDTFLRIDTPTRHDLADWLSAHGLKPVDPAFVMIRGDDNPPDQTGVIALASQAFG